MDKLAAILIWGLSVVILSSFLFRSMRSEDQSIFLPGVTTAGHYQIELKCAACHFEDGGVNQDSCMNCHAEELERVGDSHPIDKFAKATKAIMLHPIDSEMNSAKVKVGYCTTCHVEHTPQATSTMGLTQPQDYCKACHADIADNRETHKGLSFNTCLASGCHNFHDNSSLFEKFLIEHMGEPAHLPQQTRVTRDYAERYRISQNEIDNVIEYFTRAKADAPASVAVDEQILHDWETTAHAKAGINCTDCHTQPKGKSGRTDWIEKPSFTSCQNCHEQETHGFLGSRHGMRLNAGLDAMTPGQARLPMKKDAADKPVNCASCHSSHKFDTQFAAVNACMTCHDDGHTNSFKASPHFSLWEAEMDGTGPAGSGVSCATCHLPRIAEGSGKNRRIEVKHNQSDFLRPNEKMIRSVCTSCHGVSFTLDALADENLILNNFNGPPAEPHADPSSYDMILQKLERLRKEGRIQE